MKKILSLAVSLFLLTESFAQNPVINIKATQPVAPIQPTMWGVFFEDINMGADGGIYAELVKNRSFEFAKPWMGWKIERKKAEEGDIIIQNRHGNTVNPRYISVKANNISKGELGITNEGFKGMGIKKGLRYDFSVLYRHQTGSVKLHLELIDSKGSIIGETTLNPTGNGHSWKKEAISFNATETEAKGKFRIWFEGNGEIDLDMISLFPEDTWKKRPGGMRADMIQLLADMKPGFIRFPGGCIVEGIDLANRYQWKKTLGPVEERQLIINRWNLEFAHRPAPDYFQTFGLGFFEYFQLAEDIGAEPLPILNCGMACQFNTAEVVPVNELDSYVQDALDLIEFANAEPNTKWGKVRADMGHPAPFDLKFLGIGNENWGPQYVERLKVFTKAIKAKYPKIKLVNSSGTDPNGDRFDYLNKELREMNADIIDEHYYRTPDWFLKNAGRYDSYDRNGSKVFAGEYAAQSDKTVSVKNVNNWKCALSEAAFMTGLERNAQVVNMASYAPLFAHAEGWQWTPDMIWVDNLRSYGTPNYYVQKLYSTNKGTHVLNTSENGKPLTGQGDLYASGILDKATNEVILKVANISDKEQIREVNLEGIKKFDAKAKLIVLKNNNPEALNTFENATNVSPVEETITLNPKKKISLTLAPNSFTVLRVKLL
ncbi:alpha-L-arabinofuranosidase C-terminal domain-containing protein [Arcicella aquatica]|uniref:non-reducing end alpha-L-arabinofuranosidase n=1 Tax=Arcicella aquatica TaxID=217141 RepID=A0ABU5QIQ4_9BACT|nr:alpha-L-arabinofuranosidase C-terminal domain-containing protein [Arcicella aquatica]MEA5256936.1 alpha-L-arabinofuranosidase C-terminal domain-containing protein [Arcicella aquatica]